MRDLELIQNCLGKEENDAENHFQRDNMADFHRKKYSILSQSFDYNNYDYIKSYRI